MYAAAEAEERAGARSSLLVWMGEDTLIVQSPTAFLLSDNASLGCRPVHHSRVGSVYDRPPDDFWSLIYRHCGVSQEHIFPMETCTRDNVIRPYFNAGLLVVRPERRLLAAWRERFEVLYRHPDFEPFYQRDAAYRIFMHQAVLAGTALNALREEELLVLPETCNYPLHLHGEYPQEYRPATLDGLMTCRYEVLADLRAALEEPVTLAGGDRTDR